MKNKKTILILILMAVFLTAISLRLFRQPSSKDRIAFIYMDERSIGLYTIKPDGSGRDNVISSNSAPDWLENLYIKLPTAQQSAMRPIFYPDFIRTPTWLGSSNTIAYQSRKIGQYCEWVSLIDVNEANEEEIICLDTYAQDEVFSWAPDGLKFAIATRTGSTTSIRVATVKGEFTSHKTLTQKARGLAWSPDSNLLAVSTDGRAGIVIYDKEGSHVELYPKAEALSQPTWSPDGKTIAFFCMGEVGIDLCSINTDGTDYRQLVFNATFPYIKNGLTWSPTGEFLAFSGIQLGGSTDIFLISPDGVIVRQLTSHPAADSFPGWSADGSSLVFSSMRNGNWDIYTIQKDGTNLTRLTDSPGDEIEPNWAPSVQ